MFNAHSDRMYTARAEGFQEIRVPLHNVENAEERPNRPEDGSTSSPDSGLRDDGTWGERDIGGPVTFRNAMLDYEEMRRELTTLSKTRSAGAKSTGQQSSGLKRVTTAGTRRSHQRSRTNDTQDDLEAQTGEKPEGEDGDAEQEEEEEFQLGEFLKDGHFEKRQEGRSAKKVGVVYKNLTVQGVGATTTFVKTLPSAVVGV